MSKLRREDLDEIYFTDRPRASYESFALFESWGIEPQDMVDWINEVSTGAAQAEEVSPAPIRIVIATGLLAGFEAGYLARVEVEKRQIVGSDDLRLGE